MHRLVSFYVVLLSMLSATAMAANRPIGGNSVTSKDVIFNWEEAKCNIAYSLTAYQGDRKIRLTYDRKPGKLLVEMLEGDKAVASFIGHPHTVFAVRDDVIYYADYSILATGCSVVAHDIKTNKDLWRTRLQGLGAVNHEEYFNHVSLVVEPAPYNGSGHPPMAVSVYAREAQGDYAEFLDPATGKVLKHILFK